MVVIGLNGSKVTAYNRARSAIGSEQLQWLLGFFVSTYL